MTEGLVIPLGCFYKNLKKNINSLKSAIRTQLMNVKKAEDMLEVKRVALNELMKERKTH